MTSGRGAYQSLKPAGPLATLGQRIRSVRIAWGWTQAALAKSLGTLQHVVSDWEKDVSKPNGTSMVALAMLFRVSQVSLESGEGFEIPDSPDATPAGGLMSKRDVQDLKRLLPELGKGEILQVDTGSEDSEIIALKEALAALRLAKKEGRPVWIVIGPPPKD
jgi:transcriptional regulator with XRE-family HTH domain